MKLSIITPVKNAAPWIEACAQSVLMQNFTDWEWICVNDHSTDNTDSILATLAERDSRIRVFSNPGRGIVPALQLALQKANGTYITAWMLMT